jgi:hypothetical protein
MLFDDEERAQLWVDCSQRWFDNSDPIVSLNVQMLGHAEPVLLSLEASLAQSGLRGPSIAQGLLLTQCSALSIYWMFGLYEMLRLLREVAPLRFTPLAELFHQVEIVRMPLAKHQVKSAPGYREVPHYPTSTWEPRSGRVGWLVFDPLANQMTTVTRTDIADRFLAIVDVQNDQQFLN